MDRDDAGTSDRSDEAHHGDTGMIGSESEDPGPGRDTSLTDPDPVAASTDQPRGTVAMSEGDPMRTRLGSHVEGAGVIGYDVAASEEGGATQEAPAEDRPGYESERPAGETAAWAGPTAAERDPDLAAGPAGTQGTYAADAGLAAEPVVDQDAYARDAGLTGTPAVDQASYERDAGEPVIDRGPDERTADPGVGVAAAGVGTAGGVSGLGAAGPGVAAAGDRVEDTAAAPVQDPAGYGAGDAMADTTGSGPAGVAGAGYEGEPGGAGMAGYQDAPGSDAPATYTGEEEDVTGRPEYADRAEGGGQLYQEEAQRADRPGGGGSLFTDEEPERLDRPGPQEPGVQEGVYDQEADQARRQRPSDGL